MDVINYTPKLPDDSAQWGRDITSGYNKLLQSVTRLEENSSNGNKALNSSIDVLAAQQRIGLGNIYSKSEVDGLIAGTYAAIAGRAPAIHGHSQSDISGTWDKSVGTSGAVRGDAGLYSVGVYNNSVAYGGAYRAVWVHNDGTVGYVPSSRRFKQNITTASIPREDLFAVRVVWFRYINAVENIGDDAAVELGVIAEEIHDLGLTWLVDYDEDGAPFGVKHDRMAFIAILMAQELQSQVDDLAARVENLEN